MRPPVGPGFAAYFDASGRPDDPKTPALVVSGCVATEDKWRQFEERWLALLERFGVTAPFHMTDFEAGVKHFAPLRGDERAREELRSEALRLVNRYTNKVISVGVVVPALRRMFAEYDVPDSEHREPYVWCGIRAFELLATWVGNRAKDGRQRHNAPIRIVFERGDRHQGLLAKALEERYQIVPAFERKAGLVPFQACDFVAWEVRRWLANRATHPVGVAPRLPRAAMLRLSKRHASDSAQIAEWDTLVRNCERLGYPRRAAS